MNNQESKPLLCPFCGAPQRGFIPPNTVQVKCRYCGGIFLVPPLMGVGAYQCFGHHDRLAVGICNDCGESFCGECLHVYELETEHARAILHLCPRCLRRRYVEKADAAIYMGIFFLLCGVFFGLFGVFSEPVLLSFGVLGIIAGVGSMIYGVSRRAETPKELTIDELRVGKETRKAELEGTAIMDAEEMFDKLLTQYVDRWGVQSGLEILESEIMAYTRHGVSFPEAVQKVYQRQFKRQTKRQTRKPS